MPNAQEAIGNLQAQAIDAIKSGQDAAVEAVQAWSDAVAKVTPEGVPPVGDLPAGLMDTVGDPSEIVDSVYDFASQLIELNKQFVHRLLGVSDPTKSASPAPRAKSASTK